MKRTPHKLKHFFLKDINPVIRFLIISDTAIVGGAALLAPIFAIFVEDFIKGGDEAVAGLAMGIFLFTRSILQIPIAHLVDTIRGEMDDFWFMFIFSVLKALVPLLYLAVETPAGLYAVQFTLGLLTAFTYPTYMAIFTRHIDSTKEGTEWGVYFTLTDLSSAGLAAVGGFIAVFYGFPALIFAITLVSLAGALLLLPIRPYMRKI
ncbi:MFS transporter [bacterium]|nr:MFS transporter [bacterium]MCI0566423.1 MFS transporter [bacterium]MCI0680185.1 MFS transporter [bacterium]